LRSARDADATSRQWIRARTEGFASAGNDRQQFFMLQKIARLRRRIVGGGVLDSTSTTSAFVITELGHQDYFVARQLSNVALVGGVPTASIGVTDIAIAKVKNVRRSIVSQLLYGDTVTYSDDDPTDIDNTRNADKTGSATEPQDCLPPYITAATLGISGAVPMNSQCVVYAKKLPGLTGVYDDSGKAIDWIEDCGHDGVRAFAERNPSP